MVQPSRTQFDVKTLREYKLGQVLHYSQELFNTKPSWCVLCGDNEDDQEQYILQALVVHQGGTVGGHYYLYTRMCSQKVYTKAELLNDSKFIELNDTKSQ